MAPKSSPRRSPRRSPRNAKHQPAPAIRKSTRIANGAGGKASKSSPPVSTDKKMANKSTVGDKKRDAKAKKHAKHGGEGAASASKARTVKAKPAKVTANKKNTATTPGQSKAPERELRRSARIANQAA